MDLRQASLNSVTIRGAGLGTVLDLAVHHGFGYVGLWRDVVSDGGAVKASREVRARGLGVSSLCRAGMFTSADPAGRRQAWDENRRAVEECHDLDAMCLVLVCGGVSDKDLEGARARIADGIAELLPVARAAGVRLAIEPMHPMMAADRSAITSLSEANDLVAQFDDDHVGITLDAYHVWWDARLEDEITRAAGTIWSAQVSDWVLPLAADHLAGRGLPGTGCIDLTSFLGLARGPGNCSTPIEIEVLSTVQWARHPHDVVADAARSLRQLVDPSSSTNVEPVTGNPV